MSFYLEFDTGSITHLNIREEIKLNMTNVTFTVKENLIIDFRFCKCYSDL